MDPISSFFLQTIISGIIGNRTDFLTVEAYKKVINQFKGSDKPLNQDIEKAVRKAYLQATIVVCQAVQEKEKREQGWKGVFIQNTNISWVLELKRDSQKEILKIDSGKKQPEEFSFEVDTVLLLKPDLENAKERTKKLKELFSGHLLESLQKKYEYVPEVFEEFLLNGWKTDDESKVQRWFDFLCAFFSFDLKENEQLRTAFEGGILADLQVADIPLTLEDLSTELSNQGEVAIDLMLNIEKLISYQQESFSELLKKNDRLFTYLVKVKQDLTSIIEKELSRRSLANMYAGREVAQIVERRIEAYIKPELFGRRKVLQKIDSFIANNERGSILITGLAGYGKTSILANWIHAARQNNTFIISHFFTAETADLNKAYVNLLRQLYIYYELENQPIPENNERLRDIILGLTTELGARKREGLIIVLDGLDEAQNSFTSPFPDPLPEGMYTITAARSGKKSLPDFLHTWIKKSNRIHVEELDKAAIYHWLNAKSFFIRLDAIEKEGLVQKLNDKTRGFPLFLNYLIEDIESKKLNLSSFGEYLRSVPNNFREYVRDEFRKLSKNDKIRKNKELHNFFSVVSVAKNPLSEIDIEHLTQLTTWDLVDLPWQIVRWFDVSRIEGVQHYKFAHPMLANLFAEILGRQSNVAKKTLLQYCHSWETEPSAYIFNSYATHLIDEGQIHMLYALLTNSQDWVRKKSLALLSYKGVFSDINLALDSLSIPDTVEKLTYKIKLSMLEKQLRKKIKGYSETDLEILALFGDVSEALKFASSRVTEKEQLISMAHILRAILLKGKIEQASKDRVTVLFNNILTNTTPSIDLVKSLFHVYTLLSKFEEVHTSCRKIKDQIHLHYSKLYNKDKIILLNKVDDYQVEGITLNAEFLNEYWKNIIEKKKDPQAYFAVLFKSKVPSEHLEELIEYLKENTAKFPESLDLLAAYLVKSDLSEPSLFSALQNDVSIVPLEFLLAHISKKNSLRIKRLLQKHFHKLSFGERERLIFSLIKNEEMNKGLLLQLKGAREEEFIEFYINILFGVSCLKRGRTKKAKVYFDRGLSEIHHFGTQIQKKDEGQIFDYYNSILSFARELLSEYVPELFSTFLFDFPIQLFDNKDNFYILTLDFYLQYSQNDPAKRYFEKVSQTHTFKQSNVKEIAKKLAVHFEYELAQKFYSKHYSAMINSPFQSKREPIIFGLIAYLLKIHGDSETAEIIFQSLEEYTVEEAGSLSPEVLNLLNVIWLKADKPSILGPAEERVDISPLVLNAHFQKKDFKGAYEMMFRYFENFICAENSTVSNKVWKLYISCLYIIKYERDYPNAEFIWKIFDLIEKSLEHILSQKKDDLYKLFESTPKFPYKEKLSIIHNLFIVCLKREKIWSLLQDLISFSSAPITTCNDLDIMDSCIHTLLGKGFFNEAEEFIEGLGLTDFYTLFSLVEYFSINGDIHQKLRKELFDANHEIFSGAERDSLDKLNLVLDHIRELSLERYTIYLLTIIKNTNIQSSSSAFTSILHFILENYSQMDHVFGNRIQRKLKAVYLLGRKEKNSFSKQSKIQIRPSEITFNLKAFLYFHKGEILIANDRLDEAFKEYQKAIHNDPNFKLYYLRRGICFTRMQKFEEAIDDFKKGLSSRGEMFLQSAGWVLTLYLYSGQFDQAEMILVDLTKEKTDHQLFYLNWMTEIQLHKGESEKAKYFMDRRHSEIMKSSIEQEVNHYYIKLDYAYYYLLVGEMESAKALFEETLKYYEENKGWETIEIPLSIYEAGFYDLIDKEEINSVLDTIKKYHKSYSFRNTKRLFIIWLKLNFIFRQKIGSNNHDSNQSVIFNLIFNLSGQTSNIYHPCVPFGETHVLPNILELPYEEYLFKKEALSSIFKVNYHVSEFDRNSFWSMKRKWLPINEKLSKLNLEEQVVMLVQGTNLLGETVFSYLEVKLKDYRDLRLAMLLGKNFTPSDYGKVIYSGRGEPSLAVRLEMKVKYDMLDIGDKMKEIKGFIG